MDFSAVAQVASESTGIAWTSNVVDVLRLASAKPVLLLTLLGSLAPTLAAIAMLLYLRNRTLWVSFFSRFKLYSNGTLAGALSVYLSIFALLIPCLIFICEVRIALGAEYGRTVSFDLQLIGPILAIAFLDQGALLEEVGWRGFAAPELQRLFNNPLSAALLIGVCWGIWHLPRDIATGVIDRLGLASYLTQYLPAFLLGTISVSIIAGYFMNRLGGSVVAAIVVHGITNDAIGISGSASIVDALTPFHQMTKNLPFAAVAAGIVFVAGRALGLGEAGHQRT